MTIQTEREQHHGRVHSQVEHRTLKAWREQHPEEWQEGWAAILMLVNLCYTNLTPRSRHAHARNCMRSALVQEHPIEWSILWEQSRREVLADPRYRA